MQKIKIKSAYHLLPWRTALRLNIVFWLGGICVGIAAVVMTALAKLSDHFLHNYVLHYRYLPFISTPVSLVIIALITRKFFRGAEGSGVPQVIAALNPHCRYQKHLISLWTALGKYLLLPALMFGASVGREGPTIQVGAAIMFALASLIKTNRADCRSGLIMAGGAAGIGAAFNAPLAGIVFAIECLAKRFEHHITDIMLGAVALGSMVGYFTLGHQPVFGKAIVDITNLQGWLSIVMMGIIGGLLGGVFSYCFIATRRWMNRISLRKSLLITFVFGLLVALLGYLSHGFVFGTGYQQTSMIIANHEYPAVYSFYKILANFLSSTSGIPGGIFSPSITVGAGLGQIVSHWFPHVEPDIIVLAGIVAFFCGVTQTPITCFAIVIEMEHVSSMAVPLIVAALIAKFFASLICKRPFFDALADMLIAENEYHTAKQVKKADFKKIR
ncbi:MAG: chloride channel protein [Pseudomonadota bacterium]